MTVLLLTSVLPHMSTINRRRENNSTIVSFNYPQNEQCKVDIGTHSFPEMILSVNDTQGKTYSEHQHACNGDKTAFSNAKSLTEIDDFISVKNLVEKTTGVFSQYAETISKTLLRYDPLVFPGASASASASARLSVIPLTQKTPLDDVRKEKINFSCIEHRDILTVADVFIQIAKTIENPVTEMTKETKVLSYYSEAGGCPTDDELIKINEITAKIDSIIKDITGLFPQLNYLHFSMNIIAPTIRMIADAMQGEKLSQADTEYLGKELLGYIKAMIYITPKKTETPINVDMDKIPDSIFFKDGGVYIQRNSELLELSKTNDKLYASDGHNRYEVHYDPQKREWEALTSQTEIANNHYGFDEYVANSDKSEDPLFVNCSTRRRRGAVVGKMCSSYVDDDMKTLIPTPAHFDAYVRYNNDRVVMGSMEQAVINKLDTGLNKNFFGIKKMVFYDGWTVYRIRTGDKLKPTFYHAIEMGGKLVPFRTKQIYTHLLHAEIYNIGNRENRYRYNVEFFKNTWQFEPNTSFCVSTELMDVLSPIRHDILDSDAKFKELSVSGPHGFKSDAAGHAYLKINNDFIKIVHHDNVPTIISKSGDVYHLIYNENKYYLNDAVTQKGALTLNSKDIQADRAMASVKGLRGQENIKISSHWDLLDSHIYVFDAKDNSGVGSRIEVRFRVKYTADSTNTFYEIPDLRWMEKIKCLDDDRVWEFNTNMYTHNMHSKTFIPWHNRYIESYHYIKSGRKDSSNWLIRMYDNEMNPVSPEHIPEVTTHLEKQDVIKNYLAHKGGVIDISIIDRPRIELANVGKKKSRLVKFDVGIGDKGFFKFSQGIVIERDNYKSVFVTSSDNINLINEDVNSDPPEIVSRPRIRK